MQDARGEDASHGEIFSARTAIGPMAATSDWKPLNASAGPRPTRAIEAQARYHVSYDNDLLALMDAKKPEGYAFQLVHPELTIITAGEFITRLNLFQSKVHSSSGLME